MFSSGLCPWSRKVVAEGRLNTIPCRYADRGANGRAFDEIICSHGALVAMVSSRFGPQPGDSQLKKSHWGKEKFRSIEAAG